RSCACVLGGGFGSGVLVCRRWAGLAAWQRLAGGAAAGALAGVLVGLLVVVGRLANLRPMLINASLPLYEILSFGRGLGGLPLMVLVQAAAGAIGAAMLLLPPAVRRPVIVGLGTAFVIGLFQDLVQLMLQSGFRAGLRSLLFTSEGLAPRGAVILMVLAAGGNIFWTRYRSPVRRWADQLAPPRRLALRRITLVALAGAILMLPWVAGVVTSQVRVIVRRQTRMRSG